MSPTQTCLRVRGTTAAAAAALMLAVALMTAGCSATVADEASAPGASTATTPEPSASSAPAAAADPSPTDPAEAPVAKVRRDEGTAAAPNDQVVYPDGVTLRIADVAYATETSQGPGASTGREFTRLTVELTNGSAAPIDVSTSVVTVLDAAGARLVPVYTPESQARDFSGSVDPGQRTTAVYAVAAWI